MKKIVLVLAFVLACQTPKTRHIETFRVRRGEFVYSVTESGELEAVNSVNISAPMLSWRLGSLKITFLVNDGKKVKEGELLVEFEKNEVQKNIDDAKAELEIARAELRKALASQASQIEELEAELEKSRLQHRISELNLEMATFEADIEKKRIALELENAAIALQKAEQEINNQKLVNRQEISKLELKVRQGEGKLKELETALMGLTVTAPAPGIAIIRRNWATDNKFQVDDQPWRGMPLIGLPDLSRLKARVEVNEVDIAKIDTSQSAIVRLDALPDSSFSGRVVDIAALARNKTRGSKVKVFDVDVLLEEKHESMMPGMTVGCEIIIDRVADTLYVPLEALFHQKEKNIVYLKKGAKFIPQPVETGPENDDFVIIHSGLEVGDQVALTDPALLTDNGREKRGAAE